jgi:hypothetical protein
MFGDTDTRLRAIVEGIGTNHHQHGHELTKKIQTKKTRSYTNASSLAET